MLDEHLDSPRSTGELISHLVERSLHRSQVARDDVDHLLQQLAILSVERGGPVPTAEVLSQRTELDPLLMSGLVVEHSGTLSFPLPILQQWFAAQSLAAGAVSAEDIASDVSRLEQWRYPLIIAVATLSHENASAILRPLVRDQPAFASDVVDKGLARWGLGEDVPPPPSKQAGQFVREAMDAWTTGIGPISELTSFVRNDGRLRPLGALSRGAWLTTAWYGGDDERDDVVQLPQALDHWFVITSARPWQAASVGLEVGP